MSIIETEIKLTIPDRTVLDALRQLRQLGNFQLDPLGVKDITDNYVDTADRRFYQAGYACRIRAGNQGKVLTLKSLTPPEGNVHRREEIEMAIGLEWPKVWPPGQASEMVLSIAAGLPLATLFTLRQRRYKYHALLNNRRVLEFSLDVVTYNDADNPPDFELEAELLATGVEAELLAFVDNLRERWPLEPQLQSKFERGYAASFKP